MFLVDCPESSAADFQKYLKRYRLRSKVKIEDVTSSFQTWSLLSGGESPDSEAIKEQLNEGSVCFADPRHEAMGLRILACDDHNVASERTPTRCCLQKQLSLTRRYLPGFCDAESGDPEVYRSMRLMHGIPEG